MIRKTIEEKLTKAYAPNHLEVLDESHLHAGHAGVAPTADGQSGETHFRVRMVSEKFAGMARLQRQRGVMEVLKAELDSQVHALALKLKSPEEAARARQEG
ncbi:MAG: BolA family transcriptional regulator [Rhodobiaceae bacterium]|jgi:BolA protein|nr:BolA family transcriptional regulator [Rhodobiaceae bacterium]MBT5517402.1 BolA family transcriptional regulator [Rhodobiaceae bacterium]MBT7279496.1 BolA family transcriptional regulator [Rhodobiaceae bacterium]MDG2495227.1 BolA family transcriptional regulator [Alphaproteobacteria bacterium]